MYVPKYFEVTDRAQLFEFINANSFGILFSSVDGNSIATHLPILADCVSGQLWGHMAKANEHWKHFAGDKASEALFVFHGPHAYISPTWYGEANAVPTWNYAAVHVYGKVSLIENKDELTGLLQRTVTLYESPQPQPWTMLGLTPEFIDKMLGAIVGFKFEITRMEGKWKLNQNRSQAAQARVVEELKKSAYESERQVAALMENNLKEG